jgi:hypothetical protein
MAKLLTAYKIWKEAGIGGVLFRSAGVGLGFGIRVMERALRKMRIEQASFFDYRMNRKFVAPNKQLEDIHLHRRAFVIGNGPSLAHQDLSVLRGEITFVVNSFWMHSDITELQPTYYVLIDPLFFDGSVSSRTSLGKMAAAANRSVFIVPACYRRNAIEKGCLPLERTKFVSFAGVLHDSEINWPELHCHVPGMWNVVQLALLGALYMGCHQIYLIGCDHDFIPGDGQDWKHFHADSSIPGHAELDAPEPLVHTYNSLANTWKAYGHIQKMACSRGVSIFNATHGGQLDAFNRISYGSLF